MLFCDLTQAGGCSDCSGEHIALQRRSTLRQTHKVTKYFTPSVGPGAWFGCSVHREKTGRRVSGGGEMGGEGGSARYRVGMDPAPKFIMLCIQHRGPSAGRLR